MSAPPDAPLLETEDLRFAYPHRPEVLRGASMALRAGERVALVGANGSGKSTLLRLLVGLLFPTGGTIAAFGRPRREEADFHEVRRRAGLVFQDPDDQLFCPTVVEDVAFGPLNLGHAPEAARAIAGATLVRLGLAGFEERITYKLSGGEKRLVSLAAVLAMEPEALLLDEPAGGLDDHARARVAEVLAGLPQAMLVVSHDHAFLDEVAGRTLRLEGGRIVDPDA